MAGDPLKTFASEIAMAITRGSPVKLKHREFALVLCVSDESDFLEFEFAAISCPETNPKMDEFFKRAARHALDAFTAHLGELIGTPGTIETDVYDPSRPKENKV